METLKKIVTNQYFPAGAVLTAVLLFWVVGMLGGLSLLNNSQPPLTTLTWMLFVYSAAVLTPLAGLLAALDLLRRWRSNRTAASAPVEHTDPAAMPASDPAPVPHPAPAEAAPQSAAPAPQSNATAPRPAQPASKPRPGRNEAA
ncbi:MULTISPECIES: hypothetical protein [unclassified Arthrobacter]|uniref:hypothetical protein n=1 Tax=unclassified Arthrobacter TaxID=235627 RepID=UPI001C8423A3|nr:hypothetical protein [Arthrobacter sp. MAHUQ-56]MBX7443016.1 hypothetical protein [Arthrobacter sp. MAHUQ-56]